MNEPTTEAGQSFDYADEWPYVALVSRGEIVKVEQEARAAALAEVDDIAEGVRFAGGGGTSDYWRGFNDGINKLVEACVETSVPTPIVSG